MPYGTKEKRTAHNKMLWARDKKERSAAHKKWYLKNRERLVEEAREKRKKRDPRYIESYRKHSKKYSKENAKRAKEWRERQPYNYLREWKLKKKYNISLGEYQVLFDQQKGVCATCGKKEATRLLSVDHDHATGRIRGLLCQPCNLSLGNAKDDPEILRRMIDYLAKNNYQKR